MNDLFKYCFSACEQIFTITLGFNSIKSCAFVLLVERCVACFGI